jgi:hypothetical protein
MAGEELDMGYADRDDDLRDYDLRDYDLGIEGTRAFPAMPQPPEPEADHRLRRRRPDRWVIAIGSIAGAAALYVALTTAAIPAKPMPSPFAPAATQGVPAHPASKGLVTCATSGP